MKIGFNCRDGKFRFWDCEVMKDNDFARIADINLKERKIQWWADFTPTRVHNDIVEIKDLLLDREVHEVELNCYHDTLSRNKVKHELHIIDMKINKILKKWC